MDITNGTAVALDAALLNRLVDEESTFWNCDTNKSAGVKTITGV